MNNTKQYCLVRFHKRTGKINTTLESEGYEQLIKWAVKSTSKTKESIIFNKTTGEIVCYISGTSAGTESYIFENGANIESYCPGILEAVNS